MISERDDAVAQLLSEFPEPWIHHSVMRVGSWHASVMRAGVSLLGLGSTPAKAANALITAWRAAQAPAANAALLALQRRIDRAREALDLGNVDRARRVLDGEGAETP